MKRVLFFTLLFFSVQSIHAQKTPFFRVYNSHGKKIDKGALFQLSDTSVTLTRKNTFTETPVTNIKLIKSKRTTAHRILIITASVVGFAVVLITAIHTNRNGTSRNFNSPSNRQNANVSSMGKPRRPDKKYIVNNSVETWKEQRKLLTLLLL